jgi:hypothetical protein
MISHGIRPVVTIRRSSTRVAYYDASLPEDLADMLWKGPHAVTALGDPLQSGGVRCTVRLNWGAQQYVMKHYIEPSWRHALKRSIQPSRAWSTWTATHRLADAGIATPRPVACVENRWARFRRDSFLMYPYVEGLTLRSYFADQQTQPRPLVDNLWQQLDELWQRLKQLRASLSDTNLGNFIVSPSGQLWVIDLDKTRFHRIAYLASRHQARGWRQLLRSAKNCYAASGFAIQPNGRPINCVSISS